MPGESIEQLFLAFRAGGDSAALGEVFDRTAPDLYRVAVHLAGDAAAAEDLVQGAFLAAIESADGWRDGAPLFPWLLGILTNRLRAQRRRAGQALRPTSTGRQQEGDPVATAEAAELRDNLRRCLEGLPDAYRAVLVLHLEHDLSSAEIAAALGRPAGTVRSQISRGLELLRRALPSGVALAAVGAISTGALAQVRRTVLARAVATTEVVAAGTSLLGSLFVMKYAIALVLVVAALFVGNVWYGGAAGEPEGRAAAADPTAGPRGAEGREPAAAQPAGGSAGRRSLLPDGTAAPAGLRVHATWHDGSPAVRVTVIAEAVAGTIPRHMRPLHARTAVTDERGVAWFDALAGAVEVYTPLAAARAAVVVPAGGVRDHDLVIAKGIDVRGVVVDEADAPVAGAEILLGNGTTAWLVGRSGDAGRFAVRSVGGSLLIGARAAGYTSGNTFRTDALAGELTIRMSSAAAGVIEGRVAGPGGVPVQGALVVLGVVSYAAAVPTGRDSTRQPDDGRGRPLPLADRTDADGRFRITGIDRFFPQRLAVGAAGYAIHVREVEPRADRVVRVEIRLERGATLTGTVRDVRGQPCGDARVSVRSSNSPRQGLADQGPDWSRAGVQSAPDGCFRIDALPAGTLQVAVRTAGKGPQAVAYRELVATPGAELEWDPVLDIGLGIHGTVRGEDGSPIEGFRVATVQPDGVPSPAEAVTASDGSFVLRPCVDYPYRVVVQPQTGPWYQTVASASGVRPGNQAIELRIPDTSMPSGFLSGTLTDEAGATLTNVDLRVLAKNTIATSVRAGTGSFEIGPLPPGTYRLCASHHLRGDTYTGSLEVRPRGRVDTGEIQLARPGSVRVSARDLDARPVTKCEFFVASDRAATGRFMNVIDGEGESPPLQPGRYFIHAIGPRAFDAKPFVVRSGEATSLQLTEVRAYPRRFRLHLGGMARPVDCRVTWSTDAGEEFRQSLLHLRRDEPITEVGFHFAVGRYRMELALPDGRVVGSAFTVEGQEAQAPVDVHLQ